MLKKIISFAMCAVFIFSVSAACLSEHSIVEAAGMSYTPYYYNQLTVNAKAVYRRLKSAAADCIGAVVVSEPITKDDFYLITELLLYHDPVTFNIENIMADVSGADITFDITYRYDKYTYDRMTEEYEAVVSEILDEITEDMTAYQKIKTIHDAIIDRSVYTLNTDNCDTIYGTLAEGKGKCDGYSKAFSYICGRAGITAVNVIGEDKNDKTTDGHMWNKVYYNKKWYNIDVTWDDPVGSIINNKKYDYFMLSDKTMEKTHQESKFYFDAPKAYDDMKDYFVVNKKYAEDYDSAEKMLKKSIASAAKKNETKAMIKCSSKKVYDKMKKYVTDKSKLSPVLKSVRKKNNDELLYDAYTYGFNNDYYIITVYLFYEDTDLDDYFRSTKKVDKSLLKDLKKCGVT